MDLSTFVEQKACNLEIRRRSIHSAIQSQLASNFQLRRNFPRDIPSSFEAAKNSNNEMKHCNVYPIDGRFAVKGGFQPERLAQGLESVSIQRIRGIGYDVLGFLGVGTMFDIFQNIHILYLQYSVLGFTGYGVLNLFPLWFLVSAGTDTYEVLFAGMVRGSNNDWYEERGQWEADTWQKRVSTSFRLQGQYEVQVSSILEPDVASDNW
ncbi:hypothetical protein Tco_0786236 [Tanacetum coccineum]